MAIDYETLSQGGHSKFAEEIFKKIKDKSLVDEIKGSDSVPYHFHKTPYGDRLKEKIIGGTVAWNQLVDFTGTITKTFDADSRYYDEFPQTLSKNVSTIEGHKYFVSANISRSISGNDFVSIAIVSSAYGPYVALRNNDPNGYYANIFNCVSAVNGHVIAYNNYSGKRGFSAGDTISVNDIVLTDLTQMLGTEIADYIYNLEQTTEGAGVALFRELFPKDYYEYDAGSLQSVSGLVSHDEVGFNQWDEEWEVGGLVSGVVNSKNYIPVMPNTSYYFKCPNAVDVWEYTEDKQIIAKPSAQNFALTMPNNCKWIKFRCSGNYGKIYNHDICVNLSDPKKNGQYEPYKKHSYPLDSSLTLRGVPKLVDNKIQFDGDVYESSGKVTRRYGVADLGTLTWSKESDCVFYADATRIGLKGLAANQISNLICSALTTKSVDQVQKTQDGIGAYLYSGNNTHYLYIGNSSYADANTLKTAMSGVYLVYELATPTEETAQPYQSPQRCFEGGTEEYVTTGIVPVGHESEYVSNKAERFDALPDTYGADGEFTIEQSNGAMSLKPFGDRLASILGNFAVIEQSTAQANHSVGELIVVGEKLRKVTSAITTGQTIGSGNSSETSVAAEFASVGILINKLTPTATAGAHNGIYRGKDITSYFTDGSLWNRIKGTNGYTLFEDLYIGDYIIVGGRTYVIVDFDYYIRCGSADILEHHLVMMPSGLMNIPEGTVLYNPDTQAEQETLVFINTVNATAAAGEEVVVSSQESANYFKWNATMADPNTYTTAGGYKYSRMRTVIMRACDTLVVNAFGAAHIKPFTVLYHNPSSASASGVADTWAWFDKNDWTDPMRKSMCDLPNETQVYGQQVWGRGSAYTNMGYEVGIDKFQFAIFALQRAFADIRAFWWLRSVGSASRAALVGYGYADVYGSADVFGVRPRFLLVG